MSLNWFFGTKMSCTTHSWTSLFPRPHFSFSFLFHLYLYHFRVFNQILFLFISLNCEKFILVYQILFIVIEILLILGLSILEAILKSIPCVLNHRVVIQCIWLSMPDMYVLSKIKRCKLLKLIPEVNLPLLPLWMSHKRLTFYRWNPPLWLAGHRSFFYNLLKEWTLTLLACGVLNRISSVHEVYVGVL